jgi:ribosomal protein S4
MGTDVRVGPDTITDPAFLVTRSMEDFVTWVDTSKIKRKIMKYNDKVGLLVLSCLCLALPWP